MSSAYSAFSNSYRTNVASTAVLLLILLVVSACDSTTTRSKEERVKEEISNKLAAWSARRTANCRKTAMDIAAVQADSMILEYAREQKLQLERPSKPIRPEEPALRRPNDSLKLEPFLGDTL